MMPTASRHPILGRLVAFLGGIGVVLCIGVLIAIWIVGVRINGATADLITHVEHRLINWTDAAADTQVEIKHTRTLVRDLEVAVQRRIAEALAPRAETQAMLAELEGQLHIGIQTVHHWLDTADSVLTLVEQILSSLQTTGLFFQDRPESYQELLMTVSSGRAEIRSMDEGIRDLTAEINTLDVDLRPGEKVPEISQFADQIEASLINLDGYAETFQSAMKRVIETAEELRFQLRVRILLVQLILSVLLAWQAAAQASLVGMGRRWYATQAPDR